MQTNPTASATSAWRVSRVALGKHTLLLLSALIGLQTPALGHHSGANGESIRIEGVVTSVRMVNPHTQILLEVRAETGENEEWTVTGAPPTELRYLGWTTATVPVGAKIEVLGRPAGLGERVIDLETQARPRHRAVSLPRLGGHRGRSLGTPRR